LLRDSTLGRLVEQMDPRGIVTDAYARGDRWRLAVEVPQAQPRAAALGVEFCLGTQTLHMADTGAIEHGRLNDVVSGKNGIESDGLSCFVACRRRLGATTHSDGPSAVLWANLGALAGSQAKVIDPNGGRLQGLNLRPLSRAMRARAITMSKFAVDSEESAPAWSFALHIRPRSDRHFEKIGRSGRI
jgi:hypothetical protein